MRDGQKKIRIKFFQKLMAGFGLITIILILVFFFGNRIIYTFESNIKETYTRNILFLSRIFQLQTHSNKIRLLEAELTNLTDYWGISSRVDELIKEFEQFENKLNQLILSLNPQPQEILHLEQHWQNYRTQLDFVINYALETKMAEARQVSMYTSLSDFREFSRILGKFADRNEKEAQQAYVQSLSRLHLNRTYFTIMSIIGIIIAIFSVFFLSRSVSRRIQMLREAARRVTNGNLGYPIKVSGNDEIADLAISLEKMSNALQRRGTKLKKREVELRRTVAQLNKITEEQNTLLSTVPAMIFWTDKDGKFLRVNKSFATALHKEVAELEGKSLFDLYPRDMAQKFYNDNLEVIKSGTTKTAIDEPVKTPDGIMWVSSHKIPYTSDKGDIIGIIGFFLDITKRKAVENQLQESKSLLQRVFDGISDPLFVLDRGLRIKILNKAAVQYHRAPNFRELIGKPCYVGFMGKPLPCEGCGIPEMVLRGDAAMINRKSFVYPDRYEQIDVFPLSEEQNKTGRAVVRIHDITEKKKTDEQLIRADRLSSLGLLSGGIAHEIRNPLSSISLFLDILSDPNRFDHPDKELEILEETKENVNKIAGIIKRVLDFAKPSITGRKEVDLNELIRQDIKLWSVQIRKADIALEQSLEDGIAPVFGDTIELRQVLNNLISNALEAMDEGGVLGITTAGGKSSFHKDRRVVLLKVKDSGRGIAPEHRQSIFNPFFTTKTGGTGLGLAISNQIIERHGGIFSCESEPGTGTTFSIELPVTRGD